MTEQKDEEKEYSIPSSHPRFESLRLREAIADGVARGITAPEGLIAHGRGEAFDYLLGECTQPPAEAAIKAAAAELLLAEQPVLSVNGNVATLVPKEMVTLSEFIPAQLEVNIFYYSDKRFSAIISKLKSLGATDVLGEIRNKSIPGIDSARGACTWEGIYTADVVFVPLEDGDRAEGLCKMGKKVISIDLNPLSRTSQVSTITIVDNLVRALPKLIEYLEKFKDLNKTELEKITKSFDNKQNLKEILKIINDRLMGFEF